MKPVRTKRKDGSVVWLVRWRERGRDSARRSKAFSNKANAEKWITHLRNQKELGQLATASTIPLAELACIYIEQHLPGLATRTRRDYARAIERHILPRLGDQELRSINLMAVERFRRDLERDGVDPSTIRRAMMILQGMLSRAVAWGYITANPARDARKPPIKRRRRVRPLSPSELEDIRDVLLDAGHAGDATLVSVLAYAGLRPQEALALQWHHVGRQTLLVEQRAVFGEITPATKNGDPSRTVGLLGPLRSDLLQRRIALGNPPDSALVFPRATDGQPWLDYDWLNWGRRTWHSALKTACLPPMPPYDLRHGYASLLVYEGRSVNEIAEQLGHSPAITWSTYSHVIEDLRGCSPEPAEQRIAAARAARESRARAREERHHGGDGRQRRAISP